MGLSEFEVNLVDIVAGQPGLQSDTLSQAKKKVKSFLEFYSEVTYHSVLLDKTVSKSQRK